MPDNTKNLPDVKPADASTYKQVLKNMSGIQNIIEDANAIGGSFSEAINKANEKLAEVEKVVDEAIVNPPDTGGLVDSEEGVKVLGLHVLTKHADEDIPYDQYSQGITWEFKLISVLGLTGKDGMVGTYCALQTIKRDSPIEGEPEVLAAPEFQMAYSPDGIYFYKRMLRSDKTWGEWQDQDLGDDFRYQIVESTTEPSDQLPGEYWAEPIN